MPLKLSRRGLAALANFTELDDERVEILWIIKEQDEEPRGVATLSKVIKETGRGREAIRDIRHLTDQGYIQMFDY